MGVAVESCFFFFLPLILIRSPDDGNQAKRKSKEAGKSVCFVVGAMVETESCLILR